MASKSVSSEVGMRSWNVEHMEQLESAARFIVEHVDRSGFMSASPSYKWYVMHWFRDSAFTSTALFEAGEFLKNKNPELSKKCIETAKRINSFNIGAIANHMDHVKKGNSIALELGDFNQLKYHVPAKVGKNGKLLKGQVNGVWVDDTTNNGLVQYDSVPLVLMALQKELETTGSIDATGKSFLNNNLKPLVEYMSKYFKTECCNAWEEDCGMGHAYDVAAIYSGLESAKKLSEELSLSFTPKMIDGVVERDYRGGPLKFLKDHFIRDGILWGMRDKFSWAPRIEKGVDTQLIFVFNMFGVNDKTLGMTGVVGKTMAEIEGTLFSYYDPLTRERGFHMLSWRYRNDSYFTGGRWLIGGAQRAMHYLLRYPDEKGIGVAEDYSKYFGDKFNGSYPEQVMEHVAAPLVEDQKNPRKLVPFDRDGYLAANKGEAIPELMWSFAEILRMEVRLGKLVEEMELKELAR